MIRIKKFTTIIFFVVFAMNYLYCDVTKSAGGILNGPSGGRPLGMGGAFVGLADSMSAIYQNPAGLVYVTRPEFISIYQQRLFDTYFASLGFARPFPKDLPGSFGCSLASLQSGDIELNLTNPDGSLKESKVVDSLSEYLLNLSLSFELSGTLFLGINSKLLYSTLVEEYKAQTFTNDIGLLFRPIDSKISVGVVAKNQGGSLKYKDEKCELASEYVLGFAYRLVNQKKNKVIFVGDLIKTEELKTNIGLEYSHGLFSLRGGYKIGYDLGSFTYGCGIRIGSMIIDYAFVPYSEFDPTHNISVRFGFYATSKYEQGQDFLKQGMYKRAILTWERIPEDSPDYEKAQDGIISVRKNKAAAKFYENGNGYLKKEKYGEALINYKKVSAIIENYKDVDVKIKSLGYIIEGNDLFKNGNYDASIKQFNKALSIVSDKKVKNIVINYKNEVIRKKEMEKKDKQYMLQEVSSNLTALKSRIEKSKSDGFNVKNIEEAIKEAQEIFSKGALSDANEKIRLINVSIDRLYNEHYANLIEEAEKKVKKAKEVGIDVSFAEELIYQSRSALVTRKYEDIEKTTKEVEKYILKEMEMFKDRARIKDLKRRNIAVADLVAESPVSPANAQFITKFFRTALVKSKLFNVLDRSKMEIIFAEQSFQETGCTTEDCAIQMGKLLNVHLITIGSCGQLFDEFVLIINIVDVETGKIIWSDKESSKWQEKTEDVQKIIDNIVERIINEFE